MIISVNIKAVNTDVGRQIYRGGLDAGRHRNPSTITHGRTTRLDMCADPRPPEGYTADQHTYSFSTNLTKKPKETIVSQILALCFVHNNADRSSHMTIITKPRGTTSSLCTTCTTPHPTSYHYTADTTATDSCIELYTPTASCLVNPAEVQKKQPSVVLRADYIQKTIIYLWFLSTTVQLLIVDYVRVDDDVVPCLLFIHKRNTIFLRNLGRKRRATE